MASTLQLAAEVLPHFQENVLRGWPRTYGFYAHAIGRNQATEAMVIGKAMHAIGAACILTRVPVAPIHFVERADGEWRGVFESAWSESTHVLPAWNTLAVSARVHKYSEQDFSKIAKAIQIIPKHFPSDWQSPQQLWNYLIYAKAEGDITWLQR